MGTYTSESDVQTLEQVTELTASRSERGGPFRNRTVLRPPSLHKALLVCSDLIAILAAQALIAVFGFPFIFNGRGSELVMFLPVFVLCTLGTLWLLGAFRMGNIGRPERELECVVKGLFTTLVFVLLAGSIVRGAVAFSWGGISLWFAAMLVMLLTGRFVIRSLCYKLWKAGYGQERMVFIGSLESLRDFQSDLVIQRCQRYKTVGAIVTGEMSPKPPDLIDCPNFEEVPRWRETVERTSPHLVVLGLTDLAGDTCLAAEVLAWCRQRGTDVVPYSRLFQASGLRCETNRGPWRLRLVPPPAWSLLMQRGCKRVLDLAIGLIGSVLTILIAPLVWCLITVEDPGPLFYRREYVARDGIIRYYLKFRTMIKNADEILSKDAELRARFLDNHKLRHDPRILKSGRILRKLSIDEFPQFFSVLTGKLTFVGPRVISWAETKRYGELLDKRLSVKQGLTGYWQTMGRQTTTYNERVLMDMYYIDNWSIWMDLVIIGKTFGSFFVQKGAY